MRGGTSGGVYVPCIYSHARWGRCTSGLVYEPCILWTVYLLAYKVRTVYLFPGEDDLHVPCMYSNASWGRCTSGGVYVRVFTRMPSREDVPLVKFMYRVFTRMPSGEEVPLVEFMYRVFTRMPNGEEVPLVEFMWWRLRTLYFLALQVRDLNYRSLAWQSGLDNGANWETGPQLILY